MGWKWQFILILPMNLQKLSFEMKKKKWKARREREIYQMRDRERTQGGFWEDGKKFMPHFITNVGLHNTNSKRKESVCVSVCACVYTCTAPGFKLFIHTISIHPVLNPITCLSASHHWHMQIHNSWILIEQTLFSNEYHRRTRSAALNHLSLVSCTFNNWYQ